jgi:hypothetical protein
LPALQTNEVLILSSIVLPETSFALTGSLRLAEINFLSLRWKYCAVESYSLIVLYAITL